VKHEVLMMYPHPIFSVLELMACILIVFFVLNCNARGRFDHYSRYSRFGLYLLTLSAAVGVIDEGLTFFLSFDVIPSGLAILGTQFGIAIILAQKWLDCRKEPLIHTGKSSNGNDHGNGNGLPKESNN
jgi:hypothetical protein